MKDEDFISGVGCLVAVLWLVSFIFSLALTGVIIWAIIHVVSNL